MDKTIQFALMAKAKKVFGGDQTFLSFPVTPLGFKREQLNFGIDHNLQYLLAFTKLVNQLPEDEAWNQTNPTYLWEVYAEMLRDMDLAESSRTSSEEEEYQRARHFLGMDDVASGGSPEYRLYRQYKDAYFVANENYLNAKGTAESSTNQSEREQWVNVLEPALRRELRALELEWVTRGYKNEVEVAQNKVAQLSAKDPYLTWGEWNAKLNPHLDTLNDATDLFELFPTCFNPSNALESWQTFTLSGDEVKQLVKEAPAELRAKLVDSSGDAAFESLTFEFSSAALDRTWLQEAVFKARYWRFQDESKVISDGGIPATGMCPAYVTAVVFVRNVMGKPAQSKPGTTQPVPVGDLKFPAATLRPASLKRINLKAALNPKIKLKSVQDLGALAPTKAPKLGASSLPINLSAGSIKPLPDKNVVAPPVASTTAQPKTQKPKAVEFLRLNLKAYKQPTRGAVEPPKPAAPANQSPDDTIYILAFICKAVPRCPDPDPNMRW